MMTTGYIFPADGVVVRDLDLSGTNITALPDNLQVGRDLYLSYTKITALPDNLQVVGGLYLSCTNISNVTYKKDCGRNKRTIFAAFVNGEIQIGAGCFLGSLDRFEDEVSKSYSGESAEKYKNDARDCVDRLVKLLGTIQKLKVEVL